MIFGLCADHLYHPRAFGPKHPDPAPDGGIPYDAAHSPAKQGRARADAARQAYSPRGTRAQHQPSPAPTQPSLPIFGAHRSKRNTPGGNAGPQQRHGPHPTPRRHPKNNPRSGWYGKGDLDGKSIALGCTALSRALRHNPYFAQWQLPFNFTNQLTATFGPAVGDAMGLALLLIFLALVLIIFSILQASLTHQTTDLPPPDEGHTR